MNNKPTRTDVILWASLAAILFLIAAMMISAKLTRPKKPEATKEMPQLVSIVEIQLTDTPDIVYLPALVQANVSSTIAAEKAGRIDIINVDRGDRVEQDSLLMQIDDRVWAAELKRAEIAARDAKNNFERFRQLKKTGAISASEYDAVEREYISTQAGLDEAQVNREQCQVRAPVKGVVNDRFIEPGEYVQPGTPVFEIVDSETVKVRMSIPEKDIYAIKPDSKLNFTVQPLKGRIFEGTVKFIATQADARNNSFRAELETDNSEGLLRPGMIARVKFVRGIRKNMVSLPLTAVLPTNGDHIVYLAKDGHAVRRKVEIDSITQERALISAGLTTGDPVVVEGNRTLRDGQRLRVK
ncbi:efflux RND transporter periplasmic adaptor subunit [Verrucomicrobiota bacterium]